MVLQSWNTNDTQVTVRLNPEVMGFVSESGATDAETGVVLSLQASRMTVSLPGPYGTRLVKTR